MDIYFSNTIKRAFYVSRNNDIMYIDYENFKDNNEIGIHKFIHHNNEIGEIIELCVHAGCITFVNSQGQLFISLHDLDSNLLCDGKSKPYYNCFNNNCFQKVIMMNHRLFCIIEDGLYLYIEIFGKRIMISTNFNENNEMTEKYKKMIPNECNEMSERIYESKEDYKIFKFYDSTDPCNLLDDVDWSIAKIIKYNNCKIFVEYYEKFYVLNLDIHAIDIFELGEKKLDGIIFCEEDFIGWHKNILYKSDKGTTNLFGLNLPDYIIGIDYVSKELIICHSKNMMHFVTLSIDMFSIALGDKTTIKIGNLMDISNIIDGKTMCDIFTNSIIHFGSESFKICKLPTKDSKCKIIQRKFVNDEFPKMNNKTLKIKGAHTVI